MPEQITNPDNDNAVAKHDEQPGKGLFRHFKEGSEERARIKLSLTIFSITLFLCYLGLLVGHYNQRKRYEWRLTNSERGLPLQLKDIRELKYSNDDSREQGLREKGQRIYENFRDRECDLSSDEERRVLDTLVEKFLRPIASPVTTAATQSTPTPAAVDETQLSRQIVEYFRPVILKDYSILFFQPILIVWIIFGIVYWLVIFTLYSLGLNPGVGEPTFNIIDLGFLAVLIQYTGGLSNFFLAAYLFSLMLATFDFFFRKDNHNYRNMGRPTRFIIIFGPYIFSFVLSVFWATYERVFSREDDWEQYAVVWGILVVSAILFGVGFYTGVKFYFTRSPLQPSQPPAA